MAPRVLAACTSPFEAVAAGAVEATRKDHAKLIICITEDGQAARLIAK
jgi:pyruvate kinase